MKLWALLRIGYTELQYWFIGLTPETYHFQQSRNYEQLGAPGRAAHHAREVLRYAEYGEPRARLGYYCVTLGRHAEAVEHYRKALQTWPHPAVMLALAHAELCNGNRVAAAEWLDRVEKSEMRAQLQQVCAQVRAELDAASVPAETQ
jgi:hypothetical protein